MLYSLFSTLCHRSSRICTSALIQFCCYTYSYRIRQCKWVFFTFAFVLFCFFFFLHSFHTSKRSIISINVSVREYNRVKSKKEPRNEGASLRSPFPPFLSTTVIEQRSGALAVVLSCSRTATPNCPTFRFRLRFVSTSTTSSSVVAVHFYAEGRLRKTYLPHNVRSMLGWYRYSYVLYIILIGGGSS